MYFKKSTLCCLTLVLFSTLFHRSFAQGGFSYQLGAFVGTNKSASYRDFREIYNQNNQSTFKRELGKNASCAGGALHLEYQIGSLYMAAGFSTCFANTTATFVNDAQRHIKYKTHNYNALIGYIQEGDGYEFAVYGGVSSAFTFLKTYVEYPNHDLDYTYGIINGTYSSVGFKVPVMAHYVKYLNEKTGVYLRAQIHFLSATKFTFYNNTLSNGFQDSGATYYGVELLDDSKRLLLEIGIKRKITL